MFNIQYSKFKEQKMGVIELAFVFNSLNYSAKRGAKLHKKDASYKTQEARGKRQDTRRKRQDTRRKTQEARGKRQDIKL